MVIATQYHLFKLMTELRVKTRRAAKLLTADLKHPPSTEELCEAVGLSEFKLKKGFREHFDTSVGAYLRSARMDKAAELLRAENVTVASVALELGYSNSSRFAEAFRKHHGKNPSEVAELNL